MNPGLTSTNTQLRHYLFLLLFFVLQWPFLEADPDRLLVDGRGANTDEGLNTAQVRNYIHHGNQTLFQSDNLIKTPLFSALLYLPFSVFGTSLLVARITVLLSVCLLLLLVFKQMKADGKEGAMMFTLLTGFHLFHYAHFSLAEMVASTALLAGLTFAGRSIEKQQFSHMLWASTLIACVWLLKIQFAYVVLIVPVSLCLFVITKRLSLQKAIQLMITYSSVQLGLGLLFYLVWYAPHQSFFTYVMQNQTADRFAQPADWLARSRFNFQLFFHQPLVLPTTLLFYLSIPVAAYLIKLKRFQQYLIPFVLCWVWILVELHKLPMIYLPGRYLISLLMAMGMVVVLVALALFQSNIHTSVIRWLRVVMALALITAGGCHLYNWYQSYQSRTFALKEINRYLSSYDFGERPVAGAWAPSLTWENKATSLPVWNHYFNDSATLSTIHPKVIVAETDEADSEQAFKSRGINLELLADSVKTVKVNHWELKIYWLP